jgi:hypothetical protein
MLRRTNEKSEREYYAAELKEVEGLPDKKPEPMKNPYDGAGSSVFVPVEYIPWNSLGSCSLVAPSTWSGSDSGSGFASGSTTYPALSAWPTW